MQTVFLNGEIITLGGTVNPQAVLVEDGIIKYVGSTKDMGKEWELAQRIDLKGRTLMPAFIDTHSHISAYANGLLQVSLKECHTFDEIIQAIKDYASKNNIKKGQWISANAYDHNNLIEKKHPTKELLDMYFPDMPVMLQHKSGHMGVMNFAALKKLNIIDDSNGYLEENAFINAAKKIPMPEEARLCEAYKKAQIHYASYGITTAQEGMMIGQMLPLYEKLLERGDIFLDVVGYPQIAESKMFYETLGENKLFYNKNFRLGGYKIILDGSPQGRTAWMRTSYRGEKSEFGVSTMNDEEVTKAIDMAVANERQILVHCNGDAAAQQFLSCASKIRNREALKKIRPVMIHAQLLDADQLDLVRKLGIIPSFFVAHCYHWGDVHIENFGIDRAKRISIAKTALDKGIIYTFHQDTPVIEPDMLETIWCATNRITKNGVILGKEEQIPVIEAIKAVTINAAYQYGEENIKGSIEVGKFADFVVLEENPLRVNKEKIKEISVLKTYKRGRRIFER